MNEGNRQEGRESRSHREASARNRKGERVREIGREGEGNGGKKRKRA